MQNFLLKSFTFLCATKEISAIKQLDEDIVLLGLPAYSVWQTIAFCGLFFVTGTRFINKLLGVFVSYQVLVFGAAVSIGFCWRYFGLFYTDYQHNKKTTQLICHIVFPVLFFRVCLYIDQRTFLRKFFTVSVFVACLVTCKILCVMPIKNRLLPSISKAGNDPFIQLIYAALLCMTSPFGSLIQLKKFGAKTKPIMDFLELEIVFGTIIALLVVDVSKHAEIFQKTYGVHPIYSSHIAGALASVCLALVGGMISGAFLGYLLRPIADDPISTLVIYMAGPQVVYFLAQDILNIPGTVALLMVGIILNYERSRLPIEVDAILVNFWSVFVDSSITLVLSFSGLVFGTGLYVWFTIRNVFRALLTFTVSLLIRFSVYLFLLLCFKRFKLGINLNQMIVVCWSGMYDCYTACLIGMLGYIHTPFEKYVDIVQVEYTFIILISLILQPTMFVTILRLLGISKISASKLKNMDHCYYFLNDKRNRVIKMLRMDRFMSDANWNIINEITKIQNPYRSIKMKDDTHLTQPRNICPDCLTEILQQTSQKELDELRIEVRKKILRAEKTSYLKQYDIGMLDKDSMGKLALYVEVALEGNGDGMRHEEIIELFNKQNFFYHNLKNTLIGKQYESANVPIPKTRLRYLCYRMVMSPWFNRIIYMFIGLTFITSILELMYPNAHIAILTMFQLVNSVTFLLFLGEFVVKILAFSTVSIWNDGVKTYFRSKWNILDFAVLIVSMFNLFEIIMFFITFGNNRQNNFLSGISTFGKIFRFGGKLLRILRFARFLKMLKVVYPYMLHFCEVKIDAKLLQSFEIGKCFTKGEEELIENLPKIIEAKEIRDEEMASAQQGRMDVLVQLGNVQKQRPWISVTVKTKHAIRTILNAMKMAVEELRGSGWVDTTEFELLASKINGRAQELNMVTLYDVTIPRVMFKELAWMVEDHDLSKFIMDNASNKIFDAGDKLYGENDRSSGIYIIVTGIFKVTYTPNEEALRLLKEEGLLPIIDYIFCPSYYEPTVDFIIAGNSVGILSTLTQRRYNSDVIAFSPSQAYHIQLSVLQEAFSLDQDPINGLSSRLWKYITSRSTINVLLKTPFYSSQNKEKLRFVLDRAFVPDISNFRILVTNLMVEDLVLLEGVVIDYDSKETFIAPCYLPRTISKLLLPNSLEWPLPFRGDPKLLLIPGKSMDEYDIMLTIEEQSDLVNPESQMKRQLQKILKRKKRRRLSSIKRSYKSRSRSLSHTVSSEKSTSGSIETTGMSVVSESSVNQYERGKSF